MQSWTGQLLHVKDWHTKIIKVANCGLVMKKRGRKDSISCTKQKKKKSTELPIEY